MDRDAPSQQDQISLYGLFGDTTATLQGLNDHLSPSLLQQSPPCGSAFSTQATLCRPATTFTAKGALNGTQQGVLLSDFADRSPSAGSATVALLCSHVSLDNLRCTNLVSLKGNRFCSQHSRDSPCGISYMKKSIFKSPVSSAYLRQSISFGATVTKSDVNENVLIKNGQPSPITPGTLKLIPGKPKTNGIDVPEKANFDISGGNMSSKRQQAQVCFVRKVGQQITVTTRPLGVKVTEGAPIKRNVATTTSSHRANKTSTESGSTLNAGHSNTVKSNISNRTVPYYKKIEPVFIKAQSQGIPVSVKSENTTAFQSVSARVASACTANGKPPPPGMDEAVLKKLIEVLNSRSDLSTQQQISLLQSMGVTVVQASAATHLSPKKRSQKTVVGKVITVSNPKPKKTYLTNATTVQPLIGVHDAVGFHQVPLGTPRVAPSTSILPLKSYTLPITTVNQADDSASLPPVLNDKDKKPGSKTAPKRKQKQGDAAPMKKSKSTNTGQSFNKLHPGQQPSNDCKKVKVPKPSERLKQAKPTVESSKPLVLSILTASPPPKILKVPQQASAALTKLVQHLNENTLLNYDLFHTDVSDGEANSESDKNKTMKSKLLKKHLARKRKGYTKKSVPDYEHCLSDLRGTSPSEVFSAARMLLGVFLRKGKGLIAHHEKILDDLTKNEESENWQLEEEIIEDIKEETVEISDAKIAYTLQTLRFKCEYQKLELQFENEKKEFDLLLESYKQNPPSVTRFLKSLLENETKYGSKPAKAVVPSMKQCQLSSESGLSCSAPALAYASYCKQHIWHCQHQCLYKLDQNMKPAADISPEPLVKRVRKRTKLLPLIKRYKKKRKRRVEGNDSHDSAREDRQNSPIPSKHEVHRNEVTSRNLKGSSTTVESSHLGSDEMPVNIDESDDEDTKPSDTSEEDLHLTTNEIMLSGVLDKLPDDPHDFDLFTTDKGAEELERALMLAASSPTPDHEENKLDISLRTENSPKSITLMSRSSSHQDFDLGNVTKTKHDNAIINCDAPKSNEQPPSLESFDQSQCVHYTFGSNIASTSTKKECPSDEFASDEDITPPLISAEELQDIEGVLERLQQDSEDVNSPKLPSSPAIDQYTSMLARQLSQEVETESLKKQSSAGTPPSFSLVKESASLTCTYSLPTSNARNNMDSRRTDSDNTVPLIKGASTLYRNGVAPQRPGASNLDQQNTAKTSPATIAGSVTLGMKSKLPAGAMVPSDGQPMSTLLTQLSKPSMTSMVISPESSTKLMARSLSSSSKLASMQETPRRLAKKGVNAPTHAVLSPTAIGAPVRSLQGKIRQSPAVLTNHVLPLTLMQGPSQNGNVIKVIVPPGTVVNGTGGQQNMLLIPVSALMKSNVVSENQNIPSGSATSTPSQVSSHVNVKTQLSSLQAGQQFFIVNGSPGSSQTHLALVQKPNIAASAQQSLFLKPVSRTMPPMQKDENATGKTQLNRDTAKQSQFSIKPNLNVYLKQNKNHVNQNKVAIPPMVPSERKPNGKMVGISANAASLTKNSLNDKLINCGFGKFSAQPQVGRRGRNPSRKIPKAKFDPITKTYVPGTANVTDISTAVSMPTSTTANQKLTESLKKFNASTLSIQNKVQQIDSVLSSLNSVKNHPTSARALANGHQERKPKDVNWLVKSVVFPATSQLKNIDLVSSGTATTVAKMPSSIRVTAIPPVLSPTTSAGKQQPARIRDVHGKANDGAQKNPGLECTKRSDTSVTMSNKLSDAKSTSVPVSSGTVHWNQTTTAGPEITTPTLTLPVYITSAIGGSPWSTELAVNRTVGGTTLPVLLPAHKISPNCQLSQRVLLGSIGSLAVSAQSQIPISMPMTTTHSKQARATSVPSTQIYFPLNNQGIVASGTCGQNNDPSRRITLNNIVPSARQPTKVQNVNTSSSGNLRMQGATAMTGSVSVTAAKPTHMVASSAQEVVSAMKKKSGRKASHDTILHDPLMFDPTTLEQYPSASPDG